MAQRYTRIRPGYPSGIFISGSGGFLPSSPVDNEMLIRDRSLDTTPEWIESHVGVRQRHFADSNLATSDLGASAALLALENAGLKATDLDHLILCTTTGDWTSPAAANRIQNLIGADCPAEDKQSACASFLFGLDHGVRLVAGGLNHVMVIGADIKSRFIQPRDRRLGPIFADGAGAIILSRTEAPGGMLGCELWSDGSRALNLYTPAGGSAMPASEETVKKGLHSVKMTVDGHQIFADAVEAMSELCILVCEQADISLDQIDCFIPHQANLKIMKTVGQKLGISMDKTVITIDYTGNTTSATLPFALDVARREGKLFPGARVLLTAAGAGYSGGAALYQEINRP